MVNIKTKFWRFFVYAGIFLALGMGAQIGNQQYLGHIDASVFWFFFVFAVLSVGFGFKLRRLEKKGIKDTKNSHRENNKKSEKGLKGIGGWLLFFIFTLVFFGPLYQLYDIIAHPQFYFWESGAPVYHGIVFVIAFAIWSIIIGISLWRRKLRAVIWAKEFLIVVLIVNIFFTIYSYGLFSTEDYGLILYDSFRGIVYFGIWFSYLNLSRRVKNIFGDRKLNWKRVIVIPCIAIAGVFIISTLFSFIPLNIENMPETISAELSQSYTLEAGFAQYHEFGYPDIAYDVKLNFGSTGGPIDVYFVKSEEDFDKFLANEDFEVYSGCLRKGWSSGEISCTVSSGGIMAYNPNTQEITYSLRFK